jgi:hypothetical protein
MKPKELVRLKKTVTTAGQWKVITGKAKMPKTALPLSKTFSLDLGRNWHWRVDDVAATPHQFRILTAFNPEIEEYRSWMTARRGDSLVMVAQLEFHGTHPGWHTHIACCDIADIEAGQGHPRSAYRFPGGNNSHRRQTYNMSESTALQMAFKFFRVNEVPDGSML